MAATITIALSFTVTPAFAGFNWENNITVDTHGMTWEYTEQYTEENFVFYKSYIDSDLGNDDGYVSAWELLKVDSVIRKTFYDSIMKDMDVKINDSSSNVHLQEIDSSVSENALGIVYERGEATNYYTVMYSFDKSLTELGTNIWFLAEPETNMTTTFPAGIYVTSTKGIENTTTIVHDSITTLIGTVGFESEVTISYIENVTHKTTAVESIDNVTSKPYEVEKTPIPKESYNFIDEILKKLDVRPKH
ncbi:MAG: hypothetical protein Q7J10_02415 [Methanosarcinaceae archaeon]|nr:hypothetical protein [Methanosarcinaceae archaeon]